LQAAHYASESFAKYADLKAKFVDSQDRTFAHLVTTLTSGMTITIFQKNFKPTTYTGTGEMGSALVTCKTLLTVAASFDLYLYLVLGLPSLPDEERVLIASDCLSVTVTEENFWKRDKQGDAIPNRPLMLLLLKYGASPNYKGARMGIFVWERFLSRAEDFNKHQRVVANQLVEDFLRFGAIAPTVPVKWYLDQADVDTSSLRKLMKKQRLAAQSKGSKPKQSTSTSAPEQYGLQPPANHPSFLRRLSAKLKR
jgi:hypothetical protein